MIQLNSLLSQLLDSKLDFETPCKLYLELESGESAELLDDDLPPVSASSRSFVTVSSSKPCIFMDNTLGSPLSLDIILTRKMSTWILMKEGKLKKTNATNSQTDSNCFIHPHNSILLSACERCE